MSPLPRIRIDAYLHSGNNQIVLRRWHQVSEACTTIADLHTEIVKDWGFSSTSSLSLALRGIPLQAACTIAVLRDDDVITVEPTSLEEVARLVQSSIQSFLQADASPETVLRLADGGSIALQGVPTPPEAEPQVPTEPDDLVERMRQSGESSEETSSSDYTESSDDEDDVTMSETSAESPDSSDESSDSSAESEKSKPERRRTTKLDVTATKGLLDGNCESSKAADVAALVKTAQLKQPVEAQRQTKRRLNPDGTVSSRSAFRKRQKRKMIAEGLRPRPAKRPRIEAVLPPPPVRPHTELPRRGRYQPDPAHAEFLRTGHIYFGDDELEPLPKARQDQEPLLDGGLEPSKPVEAHRQEDFTAATSPGLPLNFRPGNDEADKPQPESQTSDQPLDISFIEKLPAYQGKLKAGQHIAYRILEIGSDYCPKESEWREGTVSAFDQLSDTLTLQPSQFLKKQFRERLKQRKILEDEGEEDIDEVITEYDDEGVLMTVSGNLTQIRLLGDGQASKSPAPLTNGALTDAKVLKDSPDKSENDARDSTSNSSDESENEDGHPGKETGNGQNMDMASVEKLPEFKGDLTSGQHIAYRVLEYGDINSSIVESEWREGHVINYDPKTTIVTIRPSKHAKMPFERPHQQGGLEQGTGQNGVITDHDGTGVLEIYHGGLTQIRLLDPRTAEPQPQLANGTTAANGHSRESSDDSADSSSQESADDSSDDSQEGEEETLEESGGGSSDTSEETSKESGPLSGKSPVNAESGPMKAMNGGNHVDSIEGISSEKAMKIQVKDAEAERPSLISKVSDGVSRNPNDRFVTQAENNMNAREQANGTQKPSTPKVLATRQEDDQATGATYKGSPLMIPRVLAMRRSRAGKAAPLGPPVPVSRKTPSPHHVPALRDRSVHSTGEDIVGRIPLQGNASQGENDAEGKAEASNRATEPNPLQVNRALTPTPSNKVSENLDEGHDHLVTNAPLMAPAACQGVDEGPSVIGAQLKGKAAVQEKTPAPSKNRPASVLSPEIVALLKARKSQLNKSAGLGKAMPSAQKTTSGTSPKAPTSPSAKSKIVAEERDPKKQRYRRKAASLGLCLNKLREAGGLDPDNMET